jgi:uncharacterized protein YutE (UPF0331/DUF86 family)
MDWLHFFSSIVGSLAWPLAVIVCVVLLRRELAELLRRLRSLKYGGAEFEFGERLQELEEDISHIPEPAPETARNIESRFAEIDQYSNNSAVFVSWLEVESVILNLARDADVLRQNMPASVAAQRLLDLAIIDEATYRTIRELIELRNIAVHPSEARLVSRDEAERFKKLAEKVAARLEDRRLALK